MDRRCREQRLVSDHQSRLPTRGVAPRSGSAFRRLHRGPGSRRRRARRSVIPGSPSPPPAGLAVRTLRSGAPVRRISAAWPRDGYHGPTISSMLKDRLCTTAETLTIAQPSSGTMPAAAQARRTHHLDVRRSTAPPCSRAARARSPGARVCGKESLRRRVVGRGKPGITPTSPPAPGPPATPAAQPTRDPVLLARACREPRHPQPGPVDQSDGLSSPNGISGRWTARSTRRMISTPVPQSAGHRPRSASHEPAHSEIAPLLSRCLRHSRRRPGGRSCRTTSRSAGQDRCFAMKPAFRRCSIEAPLAIELDDSGSCAAEPSDDGRGARSRHTQHHVGSRLSSEATLTNRGMEDCRQTMRRLRRAERRQSHATAAA